MLWFVPSLHFCLLSPSHMFKDSMLIIVFKAISWPLVVGLRHLWCSWRKDKLIKIWSFLVQLYSCICILHACLQSESTALTLRGESGVKTSVGCTTRPHVIHLPPTSLYALLAAVCGVTRSSDATHVRRGLRMTTLSWKGCGVRSWTRLWWHIIGGNKLGSELDMQLHVWCQNDWLVNKDIVQCLYAPDSIVYH